MSNIAQESTFAGRERVRFKSELIRFYSQQNFSHVLTLAWNSSGGRAAPRRSVGLEKARSDVAHLLARIDHRLHGPRYHTKPDRTRAVFFFEGVGENLHTHGLLKVDSTRVLPLHGLFPGERGGVWSDVVPAGSYKLEIIDDIRTTCAYLLKEQHLHSNDRTTLWSDEFVSPRA
jgi:hypothetical protein